MYVIRRAIIEDVSTLLKLAKMVHFINLPPDKDIIAQKIAHSRNSFLKIADAKAKPEPEPMPRTLAGLGVEPSRVQGLGFSKVHTDLYMFVLEDGETGNVLGTSQTLAHMGGPGNPNYSFKLDRRQFFSESLQTGTTQIVAKLHGDESGPSEIGGLILQPSFRGHPKKLGFFLSVIRFHFMGLHRHLFADRVLAEMMAPITSDAHNLLWDYLGRRFIPLSYDEADRFCQYSREFIASMLPREELYLSLLPPAARAVIGEVGPETQPARRMLEKMGFAYHGFIDPFDGGPHLTANTDEIPLARDTRWAELGEAVNESACDRFGIVSVMKGGGEFYAVHEPFAVDADGPVCLASEATAALRVAPGSRVGVTATDGKGPIEGPRDTVAI
ncbi:MAG: arginine N-succinyltransferase [Phycisphaeraceae bacterium]|nr:MAG: arginine N-succinyltransferase [Phycisphaeraceae bacterium]